MKVKSMTANEFFNNLKSFEEHNIQLQIESQIRDTILFLQEFLDTEFTDENNSYYLDTREPMVIAKTIMHFRKLGWKVEPSIDNDKIKLTFTMMD